MPNIKEQIREVREEIQIKHLQELDWEQRKEEEDESSRRAYMREKTKVDWMVRRQLEELGEAIWGYSRYNRKFKYYAIRSTETGWLLGRTLDLKDDDPDVVSCIFWGSHIAVHLETNAIGGYYFTVSVSEVDDADNHHEYGLKRNAMKDNVALKFRTPKWEPSFYQTPDTSEAFLKEGLIKISTAAIKHGGAEFEKIPPDQERPLYFNYFMDKKGGWKKTLIFSLIGALIGLVLAFIIVRPTRYSSFLEIFYLVLIIVSGASLAQKLYFRTARFVILKSFFGALIATSLILAVLFIGIGITQWIFNFPDSNSPIAVPLIFFSTAIITSILVVVVFD